MSVDSFRIQAFSRITSDLLSLAPRILCVDPQYPHVRLYRVQGHTSDTAFPPDIDSTSRLPDLDPPPLPPHPLPPGRPPPFSITP